MNIKKFLVISGIAAFVVVMALNINAGLRNHALIDLSLVNAEVLAKNEGVDIICDISSCWGHDCHERTFDDSCPCRATGKMYDTCYPDK